MSTLHSKGRRREGRMKEREGGEEEERKRKRQRKGGSKERGRKEIEILERKDQSVCILIVGC